MTDPLRKSPDEAAVDGPATGPFDPVDAADDPAVLLQDGAAALTAGAYARALAAFEGVLVRRPNDLEALYGSGVALLCLKRPGAARDRLRAVLIGQPRHEQAMYHLGLAAEDEGLVDDARRWHERTLAVDPSHRLAAKQLARLQPEALSAGAASAPGPAPAAHGAPAVRRRTLADDLDQPDDEADPGHSTRGALLADARRRLRSFGGHWIAIAALLSLAILATPAMRSLRREIRERSESPNRAVLQSLVDVQQLLPGILLLLAGVILLHLLASAALTRYRVYERRIDFHTGVLNRRQSTLWLYDVTDVDFERSALQVLAGTGTIAIQSEARKVPRGRASRRAMARVNPHESLDRIVGVGRPSRMAQLADELRAAVLRERRTMKKQFI